MADGRLHGRRVTAVVGITGALLIAGPLVPVATAQGARTLSANVGNTYGGVTAQGMPVIVDMTATRRQVVRAVVAIRLDCTAGGTATVPDKYTRLPVTKSGRFRVSFGPVTQRNDDGTTTDFQGSMSGRLNSTKTRISGTWRFTFTDHDASGAVTDTCSSGSVTWTAKQ